MSAADTMAKVVFVAAWVTFGGFGLLVWLAYAVRNAWKDAHSANEAVNAILRVLQREHSDKDPCPSGTTVGLRSPSPAPLDGDQPGPTHSVCSAVLPAAETSPPRSGRRETPEPVEQGPTTRPSTAPGDSRAARTSSNRPPPPVEVVTHRDATLPPVKSPPPASPLPADDDAIKARYDSLCDKAQAAGLTVGHCDNAEDGCEVRDAERSKPHGVASASWRAIGSADLCACKCEGCHRACAYALQAQRDVVGACLDE